MKYLATLFCLLALQLAHAQAPVQETPDNPHATLDQRFQAMKTKAETYQDYKVIKAYTLDGMWKIIADTIRVVKAARADAAKTIAALEAQLKDAQAGLQQKESSMTDIVYASTHISIAGISFGKGTFVTLMAILVLGLVLGVVTLAGKIRLMQSSAKEKEALVNAVTTEFDEYKHKALEKQTKLSRELQNERNKLSEMRKN